MPTYHGFCEEIFSDASYYSTFFGSDPVASHSGDPDSGVSDPVDSHSGSEDWGGGSQAGLRGLRGPWEHGIRLSAPSRLCFIPMLDIIVRLTLNTARNYWVRVSRLFIFSSNFVSRFSIFFTILAVP